MRCETFSRALEATKEANVNHEALARLNDAHERDMKLLGALEYARGWNDGRDARSASEWAMAQHRQAAVSRMSQYLMRKRGKPHAPTLPGLLGALVGKDEFSLGDVIDTIRGTCVDSGDGFDTKRDEGESTRVVVGEPKAPAELIELVLCQYSLGELTTTETANKIAGMM